VSLINTISSIVSVDLDAMAPRPTIDGKGSHGGYCGPAVKPIALHLVSQLARHPQIQRLPISGIGGIASWRDAAEFIALGSTSVQVCTAVMHHGYRIVEDMIEGLSNFLDEQGMKSVNELRGRAVPAFTEWGDLDLGYKVVAKINAQTCIGCQKCYTACLDGAHQCIHTAAGPCRAWHGEPDHGQNARLEPSPPMLHDHDAMKAQLGVRVPVVDEHECIGCNLCALVCPVDGCITMEEVAEGGAKHQSWNDRMKAAE